MDREIAPKPPKPRVQWHPPFRGWTLDPFAVPSDTAEQKEGYRAVAYFVIRLNILNGRYGHA